MIARKKPAPSSPLKPPRARIAARRNATIGIFHVSDQLWTILQPLLPAYVNTHRFGGGRARVSDRQCLDGIFFVLRTGCQWNALRERPLHEDAGSEKDFP